MNFYHTFHHPLGDHTVPNARTAMGGCPLGSGTFPFEQLSSTDNRAQGIGNKS